MSRLQEFSWKCKYSPSDGNLLHTFFIPALSCAKQYDRTTGFFSAEVLAAASKGIENLALNKGTMRLLVGCTLQQGEIEAIRAGESLRNIVDKSLLSSFAFKETPVIVDALELLAWMVAQGTLEVRAAVPRDPEARELYDASGIFHEKSGIIQDESGDCLVFNGSLNETLTGWTKNWDSFHVFTSWKGDLDHVKEDMDSFRRLWENNEPTALVMEIGEAVKKKIMQYHPDKNELPKRITALKRRINEAIEKGFEEAVKKLEKDDSADCSLSDSQNDKERLYKEMWEKIRTSPALPGPGDLVGEATAAVIPWPHQVQAFEKMYKHWPPRLLIADEVGLGKTIQAGMLIRQAWLAGKAKRILILTPKAVLKQWQIELREKFNLNVPIYDGSQLIYCPSPALFNNYSRPVSEQDWHKESILLVSASLMQRDNRRKQLLIEAEPWDLVVLDEAHHARRKGGVNAAVKDEPNKLLHLMRRLKDKTKGLILLTATPMQVSPIEVWDLLNLLDLPEEWNLQDFLQFFETAGIKTPDADQLKFMADLFRAMEGHFGQIEENFAVQLHPQKKNITVRNILSALRSDSRIPLKQLDDKKRHFAVQLMLAYSPTKVLISRHTRELLRKMKELGKISANIARRQVLDILVPLSNSERQVYEDVEDYISSTYNNAAQEDRTSVGFVMTIYRKRLASSFEALSHTLQGRLNKTMDGTSLPSEILSEDISDDDLLDDIPDTDSLQKTKNTVLALEEAAEIENLLRKIRMLPTDSKTRSLLDILTEIKKKGYNQAIIFTQFTDTMDFLRTVLSEQYGNSLLCFSGRGGERWNNGAWENISRDKTKSLFKEGTANILLCTDAAAEGLNFQFCGTLINYDMPWNPMKVEQRIGRIDRLGQCYNSVYIYNLMYENTVETDVYRALRTRIGLFSIFIGKLQPILSKLPKTFAEITFQRKEDRESSKESFLRELISDIDEKEESSFDLDKICDSDFTMPEREAPAYDLKYLEEALAKPSLLPPGYSSRRLSSEKDYSYTIPGQKNAVRVTTDPAYYEEHAESVELWSPGSPAFPWEESMLK